MNARYGHSRIARTLAVVSLGSSIIASTGSASAGTCTLTYPHIQAPCAQGGVSVKVTHQLQTIGGTVKFFIAIDMAGGTLGAAYGIDVNGNHLNTCAKTAADTASGDGVISSTVSCMNLYGTPGTTGATRPYDHPNNMASTFVMFN
jgi:hypothetical protein